MVEVWLKGSWQIWGDAIPAMDSGFPGLSTFSGLSTWERHELASATIMLGFLVNGT